MILWSFIFFESSLINFTVSPLLALLPLLRLYAFTTFTLLPLLPFTLTRSYPATLLPFYPFTLLLPNGVKKHLRTKAQGDGLGRTSSHSSKLYNTNWNETVRAQQATMSNPVKDSAGHPLPASVDFQLATQDAPICTEWCCHLTCAHTENQQFCHYQSEYHRDFVWITPTKLCSFRFWL